MMPSPTIMDVVLLDVLFLGGVEYERNHEYGYGQCDRGGRQ